MFERFTDQSRRVLILAQEEARLSDRRFIGTEHILLGIIREEEGIAVQALEECGFSLEAARDELWKTRKTANRSRNGSPPFTQRAKQALENANREAREFGSNSVGPEFLLIGLIREVDTDHVFSGSGKDEGAAQFLQKVGVDVGSLLATVLALIVGPTENEGTD